MQVRCASVITVHETAPVRIFMVGAGSLYSAFPCYVHPPLAPGLLLYSIWSKKKIVHNKRTHLEQRRFLFCVAGVQSTTTAVDGAILDFHSIETSTGRDLWNAQSFNSSSTTYLLRLFKHHHCPNPFDQSTLLHSQAWENSIIFVPSSVLLRTRTLLSMYSWALGLVLHPSLPFLHFFLGSSCNLD